MRGHHLQAVGGNLAISGTIEVGTVAAFVLYVGQIYQPLAQLTSSRVDVLTALVSFERVFEVLDFAPAIADRPGGLARLAEVIASTGASIKEIIHDRAFSGPDLSAVRVVCVVETTGHEHVAALHAALAAAGVDVVG